MRSSLCILLAFITLVLCGCVYGTEVVVTDNPITLTIVDKEGLPYVTVPVKLTSSYVDMSGTTDADGKVGFTLNNTYYIGTYDVTIMDSPSMKATFKTVNAVKNYKIEIDRPVVTGVAFKLRIDGKPDYDDLI